MPLELKARPGVWTIKGQKSTSIEVARRLADAVTVAVQDVEYKHRPPWAAFDDAVLPLSGARLHGAFRQDAGVTDRTLKHYLTKLESAYSLGALDERRDHRPARALILFAAEYRLVPLIEGLLSATQWGPSSTRFDLRAAFHLITRWWTQNEPRILSRLTVAALSPEDERLPYLPITRLYEGVLTFHREVGHVGDEAQKLSMETTRVLFDAYSRRRTKREIMGGLFLAAEELKILEPRPDFDVELSLRRQMEVTRIALDVELGVEIDPSISELIVLLGKELSA